jgi:hypothetical protein
VAALAGETKRKPSLRTFFSSMGFSSQLDSLILLLLPEGFSFYNKRNGWGFITKRLMGGNLKLRVAHGVVYAVIPFIYNSKIHFLVLSFYIILIFVIFTVQRA